MTRLRTVRKGILPERNLSLDAHAKLGLWIKYG